MNLKNAVALVTGGGSGLGEATVREFASAGAKVAILDLPSSPGAKVAESLGANALFVEADVASSDQVTDAIAKTVAKFAVDSYRRELRRYRPRDADGDQGRPAFARPVQQGDRGESHRHLQRDAAGRGADGEKSAWRRRRTRRDHQYRVGRRVRRTDRAGRLFGVEGRRGFDDVADRARPRVARHPHLHDCAGNLRDSDAGRFA